MALRRLSALLVCVLALLCVAGTSAPARAQGASTGRVKLVTCIKPATPGLTAAALFAAPERFDCRSRQNEYGAGDFWVLSAPFVAPTTRFLNVRTASVWQDRVTLYTLYADGRIARQQFTSGTTAHHLRIGAIIEVPLLLREAPPVRLLWHVEGSANVRGVVLGPMVARPRDMRDQEALIAALYAGFAGLCFGLLIYNAALWGALRQPFQLAYCLLLILLICYAISSSGTIEIVTGMDNNSRLKLNGLTLGCSAAAALLFARWFFEARVFAGWLRPASTAVMIGLIGSELAYSLLAPWHVYLLDRVISLSFVALMLLVPPIFWRAIRHRSNYLWMFALAWGVPIAHAALRLGAALNLVPWSFWLDNSTLFAMALEALLSSLAIAYRIHLLSRERDEAREQEVVARALADTDPLTGLLNRRAFLRQAIGRQGDQTLIVVDIDHFKKVNDTIGHDGGDEVLRVFARTLKAGLTADALVARIGGEEFAVVVPASSAPASTTVLDRLRAARMPFDLSVTASIGSCTGPLLREADWKALYRDADRALFAAKAAGRDRARDAASLAVAA